MKILRSAFEKAKEARESEVPLWLVGKKGVITDVVLSPWIGTAGHKKTYSIDHIDDDYTPTGIIPGMFRYGKVITKKDCVLEDCINLVELDGQWRFVDDFGYELPVEIIEAA